MAQKLMILGPSGTGKSHSIKYLDSTKTVVICPDRKELPFKGSTKMYKAVYKAGGGPSAKGNFIPINTMKEVREDIRLIAEKRPEIETVIIDTVTYAMIDSVMREIKTKGYDKFNEFADELYQLVNDIPAMRENLTVVFMAHVENETTDGIPSTSFKIPAGRFTKEKIVPEGLFTIVLYTESKIVDGKPSYYFRTQTNGIDTCKSPEGMFPDLRIENNLQYVLDCMKAYYRDEAAPEPKAVQVAVGAGVADDDNF